MKKLNKLSRTLYQSQVINRYLKEKTAHINFLNTWIRLKVIIIKGAVHKINKREVTTILRHDKEVNISLRVASILNQKNKY